MGVVTALIDYVFSLNLLASKSNSTSPLVFLMLFSSTTELSCDKTAEDTPQDGFNGSQHVSTLFMMVYKCIVHTTVTIVNIL